MKLEEFLAQLNEKDRQELERRVRVEIYTQKRVEHKCKPVHYCSSHEVYLCGECYLAHIRTMHQKTTLQALEKFNQQGLTIAKSRNSNENIVEKYNARLYNDLKPSNRPSSTRKDRSLEKFKQLVSALSQEQLKEYYNQMKTKTEDK